MLKLKSIDADSIVLYLTSILLFLTPLVFTPLTYEEYEFPKTFFLYFLGMLIGLIGIARLLLKGRKIVLPNKWALIFIAVYLISSVFSTHVHTSFWGYYTRFFGGFFSALVLFVVYFALINNKYFRSDSNSDNLKYQRLLLMSMCLSVIPIGIQAIFQHLQGEIRVSGTLGQPNWLASYLGMVLPVCLYFSLIQKAGEGRYIKYFWILVFVVGFSAFWFTFSLSGVLGLFFSGVVFIYLNKKNILQNLKIFLATAFVCLLIAVFNPGVFSQRINDAIVDFKKLLSSSFMAYAQDAYALSDTGFIRTGLWKGTFDLISSSPRNVLLGTGPETFPYQFPKFRPPELNYSSEWDFILNKPHNYYLELWSNMGILGLLAFVFIALYLLKSKNPFIVPAILGFLITNIFGWPTVSTALLFWFFLALIHVNSSFLEVKLQVPYGLRLAGVFTLGFIFLLFISTVIRFFWADLLFVYADKELKTGRLENTTRVISNAIELNPNEPIYYRWRAKSYISASVGLPDDTSGYLKGMALEDLQTAHSLNPKNLATLRNSLPIYYFLAVKDFSKHSSSDNIDMRYVGHTYDYFKQVKNISTNDVGIYVTVAEYEGKLGFTTELKNSVKQIQILRPDLLNWHGSLQNIEVLLRDSSIGF